MQFSEPLTDTGFNLVSQLSYQLISVSGRLYDSNYYSIKASITSTGELLGQFSALGMVEESTLTITHTNSSRILFRSGTATFYPETEFQVQQIQHAPKQELEGLVGASTKQAIMGVSIVSLLTITSSGGGGGRLATLFSVIEYIEYVLYVDGVRVIRGDQFLHFFSFDPLQLIPNYLVSERSEDLCDPGPNFARGQLKCDILKNCGVHIQWVGLATMSTLLFFWAIPKCIKRIKNPKVKSILQIVNYLPSNFFSPSLILTFVEGPHIDIIRSALLNLLVYPSNKSQTNLIGMLVSVVLLALYGVYANKLILIGL